MVLKIDSTNQKANFTPRSFIFINQVITKKDLEEILSWMFRNYGLRKTCLLAELLKESGFQYATQSGISLNIEDLKVPTSKKELMITTQAKIDAAERLYKRGELTSGEWFQKQVFEWNTTSELLKEEIVKFFEKTDPLNPLYMMSFSGARGNLSQVRQLIGMRGLMSDQKGEMIGSAIQKNFREGLTVIDFLISSYGARKGLVDTAIRTADSGYLTRRLVDIAQDVIIRQFDCQTLNGILIVKKTNHKGTFGEKLVGRILAKPILDISKNKILAHRGEEITFLLAKKIDELKIEILSIRSPLSCQSYRSICQTCFGWDLTSHRLIELGEAIGIIAAQSIGEPGTQLTMRTFHTGGVFSRELSQQIRSEFSGQVSFASNLKTQFIRSNQGDYKQVLQTTSFFEIKTYRNETIRIQVEKDDLLMIKDRDFLKKGQPILQLASQIDDSEIEIQKTLTTKFDGEIYYQARQKYNFFEYNMIVWVLAARAVTLPRESKFVLNNLINNNEQAFGKTKLVIKSNSFSEKIQVLENNNLGVTFKFFGLTDVEFLRLKSKKLSKNYTILKTPRDQFLLNPSANLNTQNKSDVLNYFGRSTNFHTLAKTSGLLYNISLELGPITNLQKSKRLTIREIKNGGLLILIPQENFITIKNSALNLNLKNKFPIVQKDNWITSNLRSPISGYIKQVKETPKTSNLYIQPGIIFKFLIKNIDLKKFRSFFDKKFLFPGERLFNSIEIKNIVYSQIFLTSSHIILILQPTVLYNVNNTEIHRKYGQTSQIFTDDTHIISQKFLVSKQKEFAISNAVKNSIETKLFVKNFYTSNVKIKQIILNVAKTNNNKWSLELGRSYPIELNEVLPRSIRIQNSKLSNLLTKKQLLEPYTIIGNFRIDSKSSGQIQKLENFYSERYQSQEIRIVDNSHIKTLYCEEKLPNDINSEFIFTGDSISNGLIFTKSGKYLNRKGSVLKFRIGQPYLFTEGAKVYKNNGDFAPENSVLGFVSYRIFKSQDIIQGLPKVEEILEARSHANPSVLSHQSGIIKKINNYSLQNNVIEILAYDKGSKSIKEFSYSVAENDSQIVDVEIYDFVNFTRPLQKGISDPQQVLEIYFEYFNRRDGHHKAVLRSLNKIASLFVKSIQSVYNSQGVQILDRHLEVIVRQMITKAKIEYPGATPLVTGEFLDLSQIALLNEMLKNNKKQLIYYKPALLGLTKSALTTESFISAASFQETVRILTQAAIDGKVDWLRGLKERVVVGGLIPCGTGVLTFLDHWLATNIFFFGRSVINKTNRRRILRERFKNQTFINKEREQINTNIKEKFLQTTKKQRIDK